MLSKNNNTLFFYLKDIFMNFYKNFLISLIVSSSIGTSAFAVKVDSFTLDSSDWLTSEEKSSSHVPPKPQKGDLFLMGAGSVFRHAKDPKEFNEVLTNLSHQEVTIALITSTGFSNKQRTDDLKKLGYTYESWKKLLLPENSVFKGREENDDAYKVDAEGILYNTHTNPNHLCKSDVQPHPLMTQPHKFVVAMELLEQFKEKKSLPKALYFIDGHPREIQWALETILLPEYKEILKDLPIEIYLVQMDEKEHYIKMHEEYVSEIENLQKKVNPYLENLDGKIE